MEKNKSHQAKANAKHTNGKKTNPQYKDTVFTDLFYSDVSAKSNLLELANALLGTNYKSTEVLEKVRLEDALLMGRKNDVAFTIGKTQIVLCEHQSTINYNMPVRMLQYIAQEYDQYLNKEYGSNAKFHTKRLPLPMPRFFVLYNGRKELPLESQLRLSDAYAEQAENFNLELLVKVININQSKQHAVLGKSTVLNQYSQMVDIVRKYTNDDTTSTEERVAAAIRECINAGVLKEYLLRRESEVMGMLSNEYNYEEYLRVQREEAAEEGREEGREEGMDKLAALMKLLIKEKQYAEIERISEDPAYRKLLLKEYNLS